MRAKVMFTRQQKFPGDSFAVPQVEATVEVKPWGLEIRGRCFPWTSILYWEELHEVKRAEETPATPKKPARKKTRAASAQPQAARSEGTRPRKTPVRSAKKVRTRQKSE